MEQQEIILKQAEEIAQLKLIITELRKDQEIKRLKDRIQELENRRFLIEVKDDAESVFQTRLIFHNYITPAKIKQLIEDKDRVYTDPKTGKESLDLKARKRWRTYKSILAVLGTIVSGAYHRFHKRKPNIASRVGRPNYYLESDFESFGDREIHRYFSFMNLNDRINQNVIRRIPIPDPETDSEEL
jgi:hypothetical protein